MPPEIIALIDKPHLLIAVLLVGGLVGMAVERLAWKIRRRAWRSTNRSGHDKKRATRLAVVGPGQSSSYRASTPPVDAAAQLRIVMAAEFTAQPLLNRSESRVFNELDRLVIARNPSWQVMAQVSLGEVLSSKDPDAYRCINSKRVDLLLMDGDCKPRHAIEDQGQAHHQGTAAARDAVKKEALRRANIGYHEVIAGHTTPSDLRRLVDKLVDKPGVQPG